jgi:hypothetical protein
MRVEFKIGDIEAVATTEVVIPWSIPDREIAAMNAAIFAKLTNEARAIAFKLIEAKYNKESEVTNGK